MRRADDSRGTNQLVNQGACGSRSRQPRPLAQNFGWLALTRRLSASIQCARPQDVAPSRGRGSKPGGPQWRRAEPGRPLTGARIETSSPTDPLKETPVAPSRGRGSKRHALEVADQRLVAPSRGRGSKLGTAHDHRPLPGSPPHGGADRNLGLGRVGILGRVAPSRGRGSKLKIQSIRVLVQQSPPHGGADRNSQWSREPQQRLVAPSRGRGSKPGETCQHCRPVRVAPSRGRGSKRARLGHGAPARLSPPHGGADRNRRELGKLLG